MEMREVRKYGECDWCIHFSTDFSQRCLGCMHGDDLREDLWEEATPEQIAEREAKELRELEDSIITEHLPMIPPDSLMKAFLLAKRFASADRTKYASVYAVSDALIATDTYRLIEIACNVPLDLQGKSIVRFDDQGAALTDQEFHMKYKECMAEANFIDNPDLPSMLTIEAQQDYFHDEVLTLTAPGHLILLASKYVKDAQDALGAITRLGYTDDVHPVIFHSDKGRMCVTPIRKIEQNPYKAEGRVTP
jgi:hypothetical protein